MFEITPEVAFTFTKLSVSFVSSWPPNKNASRSEIIIFHIKWWLLWFNSILLIIPLLYAAYIDRRDILLFTKSLCLAVSCSHVTIKMLICKLMHNRIQFVLDEIKCYIRNVDINERKIIVHYTKICGFVHMIFLGASLLASIGVILGPLILPQPLPTDAKYPFPIDNHPVLEIIYLQQSIAGLQVTSIGAIDCQIAMMLWCIIVRLKYLSKQIKNINDSIEFSLCIKKHQYIIWLTREITFIAKYIILTTVIMTTLALILGGVHIVGNQPIVVKIQFSIIIIGYCGLLYMNAWPADILMRSFQYIGTAMYETDWMKKNFGKRMIFVMQRSVIPVDISINGILPRLSLVYYAQFLSKSFSFFTTLRVVLAKGESTQ